MDAGIGHSAKEQQRVDGRLSDEQQERSGGVENLTVQVDGASDCHHGRRCRRLAAHLVHLETRTQVQLDPVLQSGLILDQGYRDVLGGFL